MIFWIVLLVVLGILFLVAELVLLPGVSVGAALSLLCYGSATYLSFSRIGSTAGWITLAAILLLSLVATLICLRAKTWQRFSLQQRVGSSSMRRPQESHVKVGDKGLTITRLAPSGRVEIGGETFEARSLDAYVDPKREVEVIGFENFTVIVKSIN